MGQFPQPTAPCACTADCRDELQKAEVIFADPDLVQLHLPHVAGAKWIHSTLAGESEHVLLCHFGRAEPDSVYNTHSTGVDLLAVEIKKSNSSVSDSILLISAQVIMLRGFPSSVPRCLLPSY